MEAVNGVSEVDKGGPPAPSPLTGCYLLIVVGEPHSKEHKDIILRRIAKGLLSWDAGDCHVDLEKELAIITEQAPEGEDARYGERLIQFASENLVTEVLIHPAISTLSQCMKNLLSSFTRHRHVIHAGYTFAANGSWILQDGTFSLTDFSEAFQEIEVQRVLRAYDSSISLDIHCSPEGDWTRLPKESFTKNCKVRVNPDDVLTSGSPAIVNFLNYVSPFLVPTDIETLLESSDVVGNIRFSHPTLYVFPGGQGDAALFGINGFNMLVDGGFARKACFWDFVRHLDRLDAVLLTRLNNSNVNGISSVLRRKRYNTVYPQIGHFFCNIQERKSILSPDGDKDKDPLLINLLEEGQEIVSNLRQLNLQPQMCYRDIEPINLYHKVGHGTLDMYVLSPARESKEVREFLQKWNTNDQRLFANQRNGREFAFPTQNLVSICALLVWQPANANDSITRILFPGSTPQQKIFEGLDRLKQLECIKHPTCSAKTLTPSLIKTKQTKVEKILQQEQKENKTKEKLVHQAESKGKIENKVAEENIKNVQSNGVTTEQIIPAKQIKKHDSTESEKSGPQSGETKKTENENLVNGKSTDDKTVDKAKPKPKPDQKPKIDTKVYKQTRSIERKPKPTVEKKASPTTPKKTLNGETKARTTMKVSPSATPAKSAKEANNRKVVESKYKVAPKKDAPKPEKKEVKERKPISRRPKGTSPTGKAPESPIKKLNELHKVEARKPKLEKEGTTDSSTVSTPSADAETTLKKDISKLTPEELDQLKARELAELKEEQEVVKEIEAVFQKSEQKITDDSDIRKVKNISVDEKTEGEGEEYLIIEKEEIEHDSLDEKDAKEGETQKHLRDSEESEKQRKLSGEITADVKEEKPEEVAELTEPIKTEDEIVSPSTNIKEEKEQPKEASKEISATSPDEKLDVSSGKKLTDRDGDDENKDANILESQPDEKFSTPIESGATTAPTLPEDERIPLDEIKEDNGDQVIEEKYVKEDTKEKEIPVVHLPPKTTESVAKLPTVVGIRLDKQTPIRDLVKTPDEVADLPVHEEVDIENYEHYQATQSQTPKQEDLKHIDTTKVSPKPVQAEKETLPKGDEKLEKVNHDEEVAKIAKEVKQDEQLKTAVEVHKDVKNDIAKEAVLLSEVKLEKQEELSIREKLEVTKEIREKTQESEKVSGEIETEKAQEALQKISEQKVEKIEVETATESEVATIKKDQEDEKDKVEKQIEVEETKENQIDTTKKDQEEEKAKDEKEIEVQESKVETTKKEQEKEKDKEDKVEKQLEVDGAKESKIETIKKDEEEEKDKDDKVEKQMEVEGTKESKIETTKKDQDEEKGKDEKEMEVKESKVETTKKENDKEDKVEKQLEVDGTKESKIETIKKDQEEEKDKVDKVEKQIEVEGTKESKIETTQKDQEEEKDKDNKVEKQIEVEETKESKIETTKKDKEEEKDKEDKVEKQLEVKETKESKIETTKKDQKEEKHKEDEIEKQQKVEGAKEIEASKEDHLELKETMKVETITIEVTEISDKDIGEKVVEKVDEIKVDTIEKSAAIVHEEEVIKVSVEKQESVLSHGKLPEEKFSETHEAKEKEEAKIVPKKPEAKDDKEGKEEKLWETSEITLTIEEKTEQAVAAEMAKDDTGKEKIEEIPAETHKEIKVTEKIHTEEIKEETAPEKAQEQKIEEERDTQKSDMAREKEELEAEKGKYQETENIPNVEDIKEQKTEKTDTENLKEEVKKDIDLIKDTKATGGEKSEIEIIKDEKKERGTIDSKEKDDVEENIIAIEKELVAVISDKSKETEKLDEKIDEPEKTQGTEDKVVTTVHIKEIEEVVTNLIKEDEEVDKVTTELKSETQTKDQGQSIKDECKLAEASTKSKEILNQNAEIEKHVLEETIESEFDKKTTELLLNEPLPLEEEREQSDAPHTVTAEKTKIVVDAKTIELTFVQKDTDIQSKETETIVKDEVKKEVSNELVNGNEEKLDGKVTVELKEPSEQLKEYTSPDNESFTDKGLVKDMDYIEKKDQQEKDASTGHQIKKVTLEGVATEIQPSQTIDTEDIKQDMQALKEDEKITVKDTESGHQELKGTEDKTKVTGDMEDLPKLAKDISEKVDIKIPTSKDKLEKGTKETLDDVESKLVDELKNVFEKGTIEPELIGQATDKLEAVNGVKDEIKEEIYEDIQEPKSETEKEKATVEHKEEDAEEQDEKANNIIEKLKLAEIQKLEVEKVHAVSEKFDKGKQEKSELNVEVEKKEHIDNLIKEFEDAKSDDKDKSVLTENVHEVVMLDKNATLTDKLDITEKRKEDISADVKQVATDEKKDVLGINTEIYTEVEKIEEIGRETVKTELEPQAVTSISDSAESDLKLDITKESKTATSEVDKNADQEKQQVSKSVHDAAEDIKPELKYSESEEKDPILQIDDNSTMQSFRNDSVEISRIDKKLQELKETTDSVEEATDVKSEQQTQSKTEIDIVDKIELGRKSPKEREQDVAIIVASVAEVLKSDAPLEEFEGKIPLEISSFSPYTPYTTELRETHITTVESPIHDLAISDQIQMHAIEEEKSSPKDPTSEFLHEERKIASIHTDYDSFQKDETRVSSLIKDSTELIQATSKIISEIKQSSKVDEHVVIEEAKPSETQKSLDDAPVATTKANLENQTTAIEGAQVLVEELLPILGVSKESSPKPVDVKTSLVDEKLNVKLEPTVISEKLTADVKDTVTEVLDVDKCSISSGKSSPDVKESIKDSVGVDKPSIPSGKSSPDFKESKKETLDIDKSPALSGKTTPDICVPEKGGIDALRDVKAVVVDSKEKDLDFKKALSEKSSPEIKEHISESIHSLDPKTKESVDADITAITTGKTTPEINTDLTQNVISSEKASLAAKDAAQDDLNAKEAGKKTPEIKESSTLEKDHISSEKVTPESIDKSPMISGRASPDVITKDALAADRSLIASGKSTPEIIEPIGDGTAIGKSPILSGKTTPDIVIEEDKGPVVSGRLTPEIEEPTTQTDPGKPLSETSKSVINIIDEVPFQSEVSAPTAKETAERTQSDKPITISEDSHTDVASDVKQPTGTHVGLDKTITVSDKPSGKDDKISDKSDKVIEEQIQSITDIKDVSKTERKSGTSTPDIKQIECLRKSPATSGKSSPDLKCSSENGIDLIKTPTDSGKSSPVPKQEVSPIAKSAELSQEPTTKISSTIIAEKDLIQEKLPSSDTKAVQDFKIAGVKDQPSGVEKVTKGESIAGPSGSTKPEHLSPTKSPIEEIELSRKSTPDIADIAKGKDSEESSLGRTTPPTVPVSPIIKEKHPSLHEHEKDDTKDVPEVSALKSVDVRSSTPASDDCDISSGQVSRVLTTEEEDDKQVYSDDDDLPGSPLSATSQVAHSTSSQYDFEDSVRGVAQIDPMSTSFYGALPEDPMDLSKAVKSGRFLDEGDLDFEKALLEHRQARGGDLSSSSPSHVYEITTAKYSNIKLQEETHRQITDESTSSAGLQKENLMTSSFIGSELPKDPKDDPIASWGKPLGLPSPAPLNDNKGTPKKERKIPPSVMAKNKLNEDKKLSDSKYDKKGKKINPVYVDLTYVPHHGNSNYSYVDFFKRVRARYYVFSGIEPSKEVYSALLEAKQTWDDKELEVTIIPTYDTDVLGYWVAENEDLLAKYKIDLSPSASRCTINLQDHETSCSAYRLEFS